MCFGTFWYGCALFTLDFPVALPLAPAAEAFALRSFSSFRAASRWAVRISDFWAAFFRMSSRDAPTTARWTFPARRLRFFDVVSANPFLCNRLQACVQTSLAAFFLCRVRLSAFEVPSQIGFPSRRMKSLPLPG